MQDTILKTDAHGRTILKWILRKKGGSVYTRFI
jgi:hypothetical protein